MQKYYPMQGSRAWETSSFPVCKTFRISATDNSAAGTFPLLTIKKGSYILGWQAKVTTSFTSTGSATLILGFSTASMLSSAMAKTSLDATTDVLGPTKGQQAKPVFLTSDDTFDATVGACKFNGGRADVTVIYVPPIAGDADATFPEYSLT